MNLGNVSFETDLEFVDEMVEELEDDIDDAVKDAASETASEGLDAAKERIRTTDKIWNKDVLNNWVPRQSHTRFGYHMVGFQNYSEHAAPVDDGATYDDEKPNWDNLREYIVSEYPAVVADGPRAVNRVTAGLQDNIYENGLEGINFTGAAEKRMEDVGPEILEKELNKI